MDRLRKTLILLSVVAVPAAAQSTLVAPVTPENPCFTSGRATFRLSPDAIAPDYRVRIDPNAKRPDLRMQLVDRPEAADFVLVDDFGASESSACRSFAPPRTVKVDNGPHTADVTVILTADGGTADYKLYVHSVRFSHRDAAALLAAMWKATQPRELAARIVP